jgi:drug/metabolite transporter (DMT)-like permease
MASVAGVQPVSQLRLRRLQAVGILSGFAAGAWLGGAEAPTKLVTIGVSPLVVSLAMVAGVFLARWTLPALIHGTSYVRADVRRTPHLLIWAVLAGCIWSVANTLTIFAIRDIGLSIAFPLWNSNSLLGIFWGFALFNELRQAGLRTWIGVVGGALLMFAGAVILAVTSSTQAPAGNAMRGVAAALGAGVLWGTMYIPYRKAYLSGMNPLSFVTFFTVGELGMMVTLALVYTGGPAPLWQQLVSTRTVLFWLLLGGFIWVVGDIFQQYAAKYVGISRGIPLSNTNQLWGLAWGVLVFGELRSAGSNVYIQVIGGSLLMAAGACAIAFSSANATEHARWQDAAERESRRYGIDLAHVRARMYGETGDAPSHGRTWVDWLLAAAATAVIVWFGLMAQVPKLNWNPAWAVMLVAAMLALLIVAGVGLWRATRFT